MTINSSLHSNGGIRQDLLAIGLAIANTTSYITKRIERVETSTLVIKKEMNHILNETHAVDERLDGFMFNYTLAATEMSGTMTKFKADMKKNQNRTSYLELGLAGLMNFSLEIDGTLKVVQDNVTGCVQGLNDMGLTNVDLTQKVIKLYELNAYLSKRIVENSNHLKGNASKLTMANNLLETELKELTNNYNSLQVSQSNQMKTVNEIETQIQKLSEGIFVSKTEIDSLKLDVSSVKAESSGLNVFVSSMQNHISSLTSNMTVVIKNVSFTMDEIVDTRNYIDKMGESISSLNLNVSQAMSTLTSNEIELDVIHANMTTIKTNLVGLGEYINNVNGDLSQLLFSFDGFSKQVGVLK